MVPEEHVFLKKAPLAPGEGSGAVWQWEEAFLWTSFPGAQSKCGFMVLWKFWEIKPVADILVPQTHRSE